MPQLGQASLDRADGMVPSQLAADVCQSGCGLGLGLVRMIEYVLKQVSKSTQVGFGEPWVVDRLEIADSLFAKPDDSAGMRYAFSSVQ